MRAWSDRPFGPVTQLADVAEARVRIAGENGQSTEVYESAAHPGWLVKRYKPGFPDEPPEVLDRLIGLPAGMRRDDLAIVDSATCWPVSRVVSDGATAGVVLAKAPPEFQVEVRTPFGPPESVPLNLDQLVQTDGEFYEARGLAVPDERERLRVARNMLCVGALLERHGVVYGDWSYANMFWTRETGRVFLIDMDGCGLSSRPWVECNSWNDPAVSPGERLTAYTDRYKLAVAVLRTLTGVRGEDPHPAFGALSARLRAGPFADALRCAIDDPPELRPATWALLELLETEMDRPPARTAARLASSTAQGSATGAGTPGPPPARTEAPHARTEPPPPRPTTPPIEQDPFERKDQRAPAWPGIDGYVVPLIIMCLAALVLLLLTGVASALLS
ncbi:hypothetical protein [Actinomadura chokoriensis]|uniref:Protein kinase domain-containing protein n=1 Tax=Actinomadura chokoriensis TaxID=454156 RepID=A0ABV4R075_9ACTN